MFTIKYFILIFSIISFIYCNDKCRSIPRMENFDTKKIGGFWYVYAMGDFVKSHRRCLTFNLTNDKGTLPNSTISYESWKIGNVTKTVRNMVALVPNTTTYKVLNEGYKPTYASPIAADYNKFVTWYLCEPEHEQEGTIFILSKEKHLDSESVKKAENSLSKVGFKISSENMVKIDNSGC